MKRSLTLILSLLMIAVSGFWIGCAGEGDEATESASLYNEDHESLQSKDHKGDFDFWSDDEEAEKITSSQVETLISTGRAQIGSANSNCKEWVRSTTVSALGNNYCIPATASNQYSWVTDQVDCSSKVTNVAQ